MLQDLLKRIANNEFQDTDLEKKFDEIAIELLWHTKLIAGSQEYFIREIEFYFSSDHYKHMDPYAHKHRRQLSLSQWYFHRYTSIDTYQNQKFKGVDITFGNSQYNNFGGILIRKIENKTRITSGIGNIVNLIIKEIGAPKFEKLANDDLSVFDKNSPLRIESFITSNTNRSIFKGPRIGLKAEKDQNDRFLKLNYNYFNDIEYKIVAQ